MKRLQSITFLVCILACMQIVYTEEQAEHTIDEKTSNVVTPEPTATTLPNNAIAFTTEIEDHPTGEYCPAINIIIGPDNMPINNASAYIGDDSYSDIIEEKDIIPHQAIHYLGYFTNDKDEIIHLYGTKDKISPNNAQEETDDDDDNDDSDDE